MSEEIKKALNINIDIKEVYIVNLGTDSSKQKRVLLQISDVLPLLIKILGIISFFLELWYNSIK